MNRNGTNYTNEQLPKKDIAETKALSHIVADALKYLDSRQKKIIHLRYWEQLTLKEIGCCIGLSITEVKAILKQSHALLRPHLIDYARKRWSFEPRGRCLICIHPNRNIIEKMLEDKAQSETWGSFGDRLEKTIGEKINPPRLLIIHLKHIQKQKGES